jgi:hypothetical protein
MRGVGLRLEYLSPIWHRSGYWQQMVISESGQTRLALGVFQPSLEYNSNETDKDPWQFSKEPFLVRLDMGERSRRSKPQ